MLLEDYAQRLEKQRTINREATQKIMQMEASLEEAKSAASAESNSKGQQMLEIKLTKAMEDSQRKGSNFIFTSVGCN